MAITVDVRRRTDGLYKLYRKPYGAADSAYVEITSGSKVYYGDTVKLVVGSLPPTVSTNNRWESLLEEATLTVKIGDTVLLEKADIAQIRGMEKTFVLTNSEIVMSPETFLVKCIKSNNDTPAAYIDVELACAFAIYNGWSRFFQNVFIGAADLAVVVMAMLGAEFSSDDLLKLNNGQVRTDAMLQTSNVQLGAQYSWNYSIELKFRNLWDTQNSVLVLSEKDGSDVGGRYVGVRPTSADNGDNSIKRTQYKVKLYLPKNSQVNIGGTNIGLLTLAGYFGGSTYTDALKKYRIYAPGETSTATGAPQEDSSNIYYESGWEDLLDGGKFNLELIDIASVSSTKTYQVSGSDFSISFYPVTLPTLDLTPIKIARTDLLGTTQSAPEQNKYIYIKDVEPSYDTQHSTLTVKARFKEYGDQSYSNEITLRKSGSKWENMQYNALQQRDEVTGGQFNTDVGYDIQLEIIMDNYGWSTTFRKRSSAVTAVDEAVVFDIRGGDANGKQTREFNMKWPVRFDGGINAKLIEPASGKYILQDHVTALKRIIPGFYYTQGVTTETIWLDQENGTSFDPDPYGVGRRDVFFFIIGAGLHAKAFLMGGSQNEIYNIDGVESGGSITWTWSIT